MKRIAVAVAVASAVFLNARAADWQSGMKEGKAELKSISQLAFGPEGILFIADSKAAAIVAVATGDTTAASGTAEPKVEAINQKVAGLLGTAPDQILIADLAVNPISHNAYLAVSAMLMAGLDGIQN